MSAPVDASPAPPWRSLALLAVLAAALRLLFLAVEPPTRPVGDEWTWIGWSIHSPAGVASPEVRFDPLATGVLFYPPGYPYFVGALYALLGSLGAVKLAQALFAALLVPAVGGVAARVAGPGAGKWAGLIVALYPELIWFSVHFWSETLFLVLLWWAFERLLAADGRLAPGVNPGVRASGAHATLVTAPPNPRAGGSTAVAALAGLLWGLAILTRETSLYFTPLAALWLARGRGPGLRRGAAFLVMALLTVAPWTYRNWVKHQAFIPVSTAGGLNLWQGNAPLTRQEVYDRYFAVQGLVAQYQAARREGLRAIAARQPLWIFEKLRDEMPRFWEADSLALVHIHRGAYGPRAPAVEALAALVVLVPFLLVLLLFARGVWCSPLGSGQALLLGFLGYYNLIHVATHGFARYRLPALPVVMVLAAAALAAWRARQPCRPGRRRRVVAALVVLTLAGVVAASLTRWPARLGPGAGEVEE